MKIIDAHSHIDYISHNFQDDVIGTICCTTNESDWNLLKDLMHNNKNVYGAFGIHPWFVNDVEDGFDKRLIDLLKTNRSWMIGEIGLDKYKPDIDKQLDIFVKQFDIAIRLKRTVFLHCVGAWDKIFHILKKYKKSELPIIIAHDFNGSDEILSRLIKDYNVMFSCHRIDKIADIHRIEQIPCDKILVETDAKKDISLVQIIDKISNIKNIKDIDKIIYKNTVKVLQNEQIA